MNYSTPLERFVDPARARSEIWRMLVGIPLMLIVYALIAALLVICVMFGFGLSEIDWLMSEEAMAAPWPLLWLLSTFLGMAVAPMVVVRFLHKRKVGTLFGRTPVVLRDFVRAAGIYLSIGVPLTIAWMFFGSVQPNLPTLSWLAFLPLALLAIGLQTLAEELVFRGYFLQQLAARFRSPIIWMILPSLVFGALHFDPSAGASTALGVIAITGLFGLVAADLTARSGSIGAAWGFHFANNLMAITMISVDGSLSGLSLFRTTHSVSDGLPVYLFVIDGAMIILGWFLVRRSLRR